MAVRIPARADMAFLTMVSPATRRATQKANILTSDWRLWRLGKISKAYLTRGRLIVLSGEATLSAKKESERMDNASKMAITSISKKTRRIFRRIKAGIIL